MQHDREPTQGREEGPGEDEAWGVPPARIRHDFFADVAAAHGGAAAGDEDLFRSVAVDRCHAAVPQLGGRAAAPHKGGAESDPDDLGGARAFSNAAPARLLEGLEDAARELGCDADRVSPARPHEMLLLFYRSGFEVRAAARVCRSPDAARGRHVLCVRRLRGDAATFWRVYREVAGRLAAAGLVADGNTAATQTPPLSGTEPAFPAFAAAVAADPVTAAEWDDSVALLVAAVRDPRALRSRIDGLRHLSEEVLASGGARAACLRSADAFEALVTALASPRRDVHRLAARTLAALAAADGSAYPALLSGCGSAVRASVGLLDKDTPEVRREAARLLVAVSDGDTALLRPFAGEGLAARVQRMTCSPDPVLRRHAEVLRSRFMDA